MNVIIILVGIIALALRTRQASRKNSTQEQEPKEKDAKLALPCPVAKPITKTRSATRLQLHRSESDTNLANKISRTSSSLMLNGCCGESCGCGAHGRCKYDEDGVQDQESHNMSAPVTPSASSVSVTSSDSYLSMTSSAISSLTRTLSASCTYISSSISSSISALYYGYSSPIRKEELEFPTSPVSEQSEENDLGMDDFKRMDSISSMISDVSSISESPNAPNEDEEQDFFLRAAKAFKNVNLEKSPAVELNSFLHALHTCLGVFDFSMNTRGEMLGKMLKQDLLDHINTIRKVKNDLNVHTMEELLEAKEAHSCNSFLWVKRNFQFKLLVATRVIQDLQMPVEKQSLPQCFRDSYRQTLGKLQSFIQRRMTSIAFNFLPKRSEDFVTAYLGYKDVQVAKRSISEFLEHSRPVINKVSMSLIERKVETARSVVTLI